MTLSGRVHPGQWWAYEARVRQGGGSGAMVPAGPDRVLAPLALLRHDGDATPLTLVAWLDERFRSACALSADDIAFDGSACESGASTVQEMLDLLCARAGGGCCEATLEPSGGDDATKIQELLDDVDPGGSLTICLKPGVYRLDQPIVVEGKRLALEGCPSAVIETREDDGLSGAFNVEGQSSALSLARLTFLQRCRHLVWADVMSAAVEAEEVTFICARDDALGVVIASGVDALPLIIYPDANAAPPLYAFSGGGEVQGPRIVLRRVTCIGAGWMVAVAGTTRLVVEDTTSVTRIGGILAGRCIEADVVDWTHASAADFGGIEVVKAEDSRRSGSVRSPRWGSSRSTEASASRLALSRAGAWSGARSPRRPACTASMRGRRGSWATGTRPRRSGCGGWRRAARWPPRSRSPAATSGSRCTAWRATSRCATAW